MSLVLYRKYRPKKFSEVIGQKHIVQTIKNAILSGMISHAYLFSGPRGSGKTSLARLLAKTINCENKKEGEPCNNCFACNSINEGSCLDLIEIDAASNRGIDEIRDLKESVKFYPAKLKYKVFIIDEAHQLTKEAANALLKVLEEPPSYVVFVLATTEIHKMIPTIISRCQHFDFKKLTIPEIISGLKNIAKKEGVVISDEALRLIALNSQGAMRDAVGMLEQSIIFCTDKEDKEITIQEVKDVLGLVDTQLVSIFFDKLIEGNEKECVAYVNEIYNKGVDLEVFLKSLISYARHVLNAKIGIEEEFLIDSGFTKEEIEKIKKQSNSLQMEKIKIIVDVLLSAQGQIKFSPIPQLPLELAAIEICKKLKIS
jgi:DNA polymerase-3 subunit gamma/tau